MDWTIQDIGAAITVGPDVSALVPETMEQLENQVAGSAKRGQKKVMLWNDTKMKPPREAQSIKDCHDS